MIITDEERKKKMEEFILKVQKNQDEENRILLESGDEDEEESRPNLIPEGKKKTLTDILNELENVGDIDESVMIELRQKVEAIIHVLRRMDSRIQSISADILDLQKTRKIIENKYKNLEKYLKTSLSYAQFTQISTDQFDVRIKPSKALVVDELAAHLDLTREDVKPYVVYKSSYQFDKNKIKDDIKYDLLPEDLKTYFYMSEEKNLSFKWRR